MSQSGKNKPALRRVLLTGSSRGIGFSIAGLLLNHSFAVTGTSTRDISPFHEASYKHLACDLSSIDAVKTLIKPLFDDPKDAPGIVVLNAGIFEEVLMSDPDEKWLGNWEKVMTVNLSSSALISKWAVDFWTKHSIPGILIFIASRAAYRGDTSNFASYAASKGGMVALSKSIARSHGKDSITSFVIAPGFVETDMARESIPVYGKDYLTKDLALDDIAPPEQVAEIVLLLAQGKVSHMTGQTFHINSGSYLI